jgi:hypothetical protein
MFKWLKRKNEQNDEEILLVLQELVTLLNNSCESSYSGLKPEEIVALIEKESNILRSGGKVNYKELKALFYPTGPIQEIFIDNEWADSFI